MVAFNCQVLDQALAVIAAHEAQPHAAFALHSGPHLRHIIEHYEALTLNPSCDAVDYDSRARDRSIERDPALARTRLQAIRNTLLGMSVGDASQSVTVHLKGGLDGSAQFVSHSTLGRELMFLASHAVHHFAVIQIYCKEQGLDLGASFGKAPATVQHEQRRPRLVRSAA
jgi:hypothetical protein